MDKKPERELLPPDPQLLARIAGFVQMTGLVFRNTERQTWFSARDARQAGEDCFQRLAAIFEKCDEVAFKVIDGSLMANGAKLSLKDSLMEEFVRRLEAIEVMSFSLMKDMTISEFSQFLDVLNRSADDFKQQGGLAGVISGTGLRNVTVRNVVLQEVEEGAIVIPAGGAGAENIESIMAFLRGKVPSPDEETLKQVDEVASDAQQLAQLIMQSAEVRQSAVDVAGGETLAGVVVGRLRKAFDGLMKTRTAKTQKGKKTIARSLVLLEEEIVDLMHDMAAFDRGAERQVATALEEMQEDLKMDAVASDYVRKRKAIEDSEERIVQYMQTRGGERLEESGLKDRLLEGGLSVEGWQELVVKSDAPSKGTDTGSGVARPQDVEVIGQLAQLLERMEDILEKTREGGPAPELLRQTIEDLDQAVGDAAASTQRKIDDLVEDFRGEGHDGENEEEKSNRILMSRKRVLEVLAEIVQELCQPLSVITCSISMISRKPVNVDPSHQALLELAAKSADRMRTLITSLRVISGEPEKLAPDGEIQTWLYGQDGPPDIPPDFLDSDD